ncbi:hypothetical protein QT381_04210 [Galbitalea sp. SE-J8]|nr:hypothetical protein [Galbitalea sp. SE-J8]
MSGHAFEAGFDVDAATLSRFRGRTDETRPLGPELLAEGGVRWALVNHDGTLTSAARDEVRGEIVEHTDTRFEMRARWVPGGGRFEAEISWRAESVATGIRIETVFALSRSQEALVPLVEIAGAQWFFAGLFERGVVQNTREVDAQFISMSPLETFYTMDQHQGSLAVSDIGPVRQSVLFGSSGAVGLRLIPSGELDVEDQWVDTVTVEDAGRIGAGERVSASFTLHANSRPFPGNARSGMFDREADDVAHQTALYGSSLGVLGTYLVAGSSYPTIAHPKRSYGSKHTFFDPDSWSVVKALSYSGDPYAEGQARAVLERAMSGITSDGLVPHHFKGERAEYVAISGAPQPGPNLFWTLAALDYVAATGDALWLDSAWGAVSLATDWLIARFDRERNLLRSTGPLWIDVFRREGYTFDTNAMAVHVLERVAQAAVLRGDDARAAGIRAIVGRIRVGLEALWDGKDHYVTALGTDGATVFDRHDTDNLLAVAFGIADDARSAVITAALDAHALTHPGGRGTWVSLRPYRAEDCYLGNTGDSSCAMARLWWADLRARQRMGAREQFVSMFEAVRADLLRTVWMTERYDAEGRQVRAPYYHEYPATIDMLIREGLFGLDIGLETVVVRPMRTGPLRYSTGRILLERAEGGMVIQVPGAGVRTFVLHDMGPLVRYRAAGAEVVASEDGVVTFSARAGEPVSVVAP